MSFILALDQGTTSSRALVIDRQGSGRPGTRTDFAPCDAIVFENPFGISEEHNAALVLDRRPVLW